MTTDQLDARINKLAAELQQLRRRRRPPRTRVKSDRPPGRPPVAGEKLEIARGLIKAGIPIEMIALRLGIGRTTLREHGITRGRVLAEDQTAAVAA